MKRHLIDMKTTSILAHHMEFEECVGRSENHVLPLLVATIVGVEVIVCCQAKLLQHIFGDRIIRVN